MKRTINYKLIAIITTICVLVIVGLLLFFKTDFFRTKRSAFFRYFNQIPDTLSVIETDKFDKYNAKKESTSYTRKGEVTIQNSSNIADSNILDKIRMSIDEKSNPSEEKTSIDVSINQSSANVAKFNLIKNKDSFGFYSSDVSSGYIIADNKELKRIAQDFGIQNVTFFPNEVRNIGISKMLETTKIEKSHINKTVSIIKNKVPQTAYSKEGRKKVTIKDKAYGATAYKLTLNAADNASLQIAMLEKMSTDSILMDYLTSKFKYFNLEDKYTSINSLNNEMQQRIEDLKKNPNMAGKLEIVVYEYKQKNIRTEITLGDDKIVIDNLTTDKKHYTSISFNENKFEANLIDDKYVYAYENTSEENAKRIECTFDQTGSVDNNDIRNNLTIVYTSGIKSITYSYSDSVTFTDNIDKIQDFGNLTKVVLNEFSDDEIKTFAELLKSKINDVYVKKGALIGINLDPIFVQ